MKTVFRFYPIHPNPSGRRVRKLLKFGWRRRKEILELIFWIAKKLMENQ